MSTGIPLNALERALVLSPSERSDIGCRYPDPSESIEFPSNSAGKSPELCQLRLHWSFGFVATL